MSLPRLNETQEAQILEVLFKSTASSVAPLLLMESFMMGVLCACVPLASYILWIGPLSIRRAPSVSALWIILTVFVVHWVLSLRSISSTLSGSSIGISLSFFENNIVGQVNNTEYISPTDPGPLAAMSYRDYGAAWASLLTLVTETVLSGLSSSLFVVTAYMLYLQFRSERRSYLAFIIPAVATLMYTLSLTHWALSLQSFHTSTYFAARPQAMEKLPTAASREAALIAMLMLDVVMSDAIVLWRMCVVWERRRSVLAFAALLLTATLALNLAYIVQRLAPSSTADLFKYSNSRKDHETLAPTDYYGNTIFGIAAAFMSLASNACATALVGLKAWWLRRHVSKYLGPENRRTVVQRVLLLLIDSGVVYTAVWMLYCISLYRQITSQAPLPQYTPAVSAADHLNAAIPQITTIYPLIIFIFVALDKIAHSRPSQSALVGNLETPRYRDPAITVTFEMDVERSNVPSSDIAYPVADIGQVTSSKGEAIIEEGKKPDAGDI
ncbi:hypothetical protein PENSPDRAFT_654464 [Peniophora sp. CONT]|nr:hypothetical protein PENSPDRAFT_654464 [Peniophora sp. CONT]